MPRRAFSADDIKLWRHAMRNVRPYAGREIADISSSDDSPSPPVKKRNGTAKDAAPQPTPKIQPTLRAVTLGSTAGIDARKARRFKRGELAVDGHIDLHGMTVEAAHGALDGFIRRQHDRGARCVVVVTGRGDGEGRGRIRREAPSWLNHPRLRPLVLAVTEARPQHGGAGALYVLLKRKRGGNAP